MFAYCSLVGCILVSVSVGFILVPVSIPVQRVVVGTIMSYCDIVYKSLKIEKKETMALMKRDE